MMDIKALLPLASKLIGRDIQPEVEMFYRTRAAIGAALDEEGQKFFMMAWRGLPAFLETEEGQVHVQEMVAEWKKMAEAESQALSQQGAQGGQ